MPSTIAGNHQPESGPRIWAVGGGKGGVGKSFTSVNLAVRLAGSGRRVVLIDGDLGGANLETLLGCPRPAHTLSHFFARNVADLGSLAVPTGIERVSLIAGDAETLGSANPQHAHKLKLIRHMRQLDCDLVILDLGAGTSFNTLDLYLGADMGIVVCTPEPTAVQNCFAFIKAVMLRDLEQRTGIKRRGIDHGSLRKLASESPEARAALSRVTRLVVNRAQSAEARRVANLLHDLAGRFLGGCVRLSGAIPDDPAAGVSIRRMKPLTLSHPGSRAAVELTALAKTLASEDEPKAANETPGPSVRGLNEEIEHEGRRLHVQTEDLGAAQAAIRTQIFLTDGSVVYSRRTPYQDGFFRRLGVRDEDRVRFHHVAIRKALQQGRIALTVERRSA